MLECPAHVGGSLISVLLIHKARNADFQAVYDFRVQKCVDPRLVKGNEPGVVKGDELFQKVALVCAVPKRPGQILYNDAVDPSAFHILNHALKIPPFQVRRAAGPVINIGVHHFIKAVLKEAGNFIVQDFVLIDDGFRDNISIVTGEPDIFPNLPNDLPGHGFAGF